MSVIALDGLLAAVFTMKVDGIEIPSVIEVSGLKLEVDKIEIKQQTADGKYVTRQMIGRPKSGEITVTRALTDSTAVTDWIKTVFGGDMGGSRKTAAVEVLDHTGSPIKTFNYSNCWVRSIEVNGLKAGSTESATEKFIMCYDEVEVK